MGMFDFAFRGVGAANAVIGRISSGGGSLDDARAWSNASRSGGTYGTDQRDVLTGGDSNDNINGRSGNDLINGGLGDDLLFGGRGNDTLDGGVGNDSLYGDRGNDRLFGGAHNDYLDGGLGRDVLNGGTGNDVLVGGKHADVLTGGSGRDVFDFNSVSDSPINQNGHHDLITDFQKGVDKIDLSTIDANILSSGNQPFQFVQYDPTKPLQAGQVTAHYDAALGKTIVEAAVDSIGGADMQFELSGNVQLTAQDFNL